MPETRGHVDTPPFYSFRASLDSLQRTWYRLETKGHRVASLMQASFDSERVLRWIVVYLAVISGEDSDTIDPDMPLSHFDLDSVDAVEMALQFETTFDRQIGAEFFLAANATVRGLADLIIANAAAHAD
ncbi:acyl carrier protein [Ancylobacter sp.]|uniref:acyl carrier protein n=1 Tax=Ancylobacter sp. TaxID=1872567 RepID=UPI003BA97652